MSKLDSAYASEILTKLIEEGLMVSQQYGSAKASEGFLYKRILTLDEAEDEFYLWIGKMHRVYEALGWNTNLVIRKEF